MEHETGGGAVVAGVRPFRQGSDVDALVVKLLNGLQSLSEVPRQAVNPRDHNRVPGHKTPPSPSWRLGAVLAGNHPALSTRTPASLAVPSLPQNPVSFPPSITHLLLPLPALQASS